MPKPKKAITPEQETDISEICALVASYRLEVPSARSAWPSIIRSKVHDLHASGVSYRQISISTGIPYDSMLAWPCRKFRSLKVIEGANAGAVTVPVPAQSISTSPLVITFGSMKIEGLDFSQCKELLHYLRKEL